ncbi:hypothetical protein ANCCAN_12717 [Ancylostoma caninum]|uniref:Uncharacterized protein n=1 Tax=Ancylostoma caninum TaxID=29170 RepID=A0A368GA87_ANCCA|nr:hypothetical protein ANCCAN_12717 [Ancylostoma caninum]
MNNIDVGPWQRWKSVASFLTSSLLSSVDWASLSCLNNVMTSTSLYDPYNEYSFVALNKRRRGDMERRNSEKLENRYSAPPVKKIYVKANGDPRSKRSV